MSPLTSAGQTPNWSGILDPSRATDWSKAGIPGGIPHYRAVCQTVALQNTGNASVDGPGNSAAIQNALNACSGTAQAVLLPAGTWPVAGILPQNALQQVVLRGAGPLQTILKFTGTVAANPASDIRIKGAGGTLHSTTWTGTNGSIGNYTQGATVLDVGSNANFSATPGAAGNLITLDQRDDDINITMESEAGSEVTVTTGINHGFSLGQTVMIGQQCGSASSQCGNLNYGYHGQWTIDSVPTPNQFTFSAAGTCAVIGASWSSGTATLRLNCNLQWLYAGDAITVLNISPSGYNGIYTAATASFGGSGSCPPQCAGVVSITYPLTSNPGTYASGGSLSWSRTGLALGPGSRGEYAGVDTGGVEVGNIGNTVIDANNTYLGQTCTGTAGQNEAPCQAGEVSRRTPQESELITAVCTGNGTPAAACASASEIVVTPPLEMTNWRTANAPGIWWNAAYAYRVGIENMTLDYSSDGNTGSGGVVFSQAAQCWVKNVRSLYGGLNHVMFEFGTGQNEVVDSYFFGKKHGGPEAYGINTYWASDTLVQNNIFQNAEMSMPEQDTGSVFAYNYTISGITTALNFLASTLTGNHGVTCCDLFESNDVNEALSDNIHGTSTSITFFRNRIRGQETPAANQHLMGVTDRAFNRAQNFVGNVIGTTGAETRYEIDDGSQGLFPSGYIWMLNATSQNGTPIPNDLAVKNTLLRWGNFDVVTGAVRWCGTGLEANCGGVSEVPATGAAFINGNPVPASQGLPKSFYLNSASAPAWWITPYGASPWPAIGPDVMEGTASDGAAGHSYGIPAQLAYTGTAYDTNYQVRYSVSSAAWTNNTATLTLGSAWQGYTNGDSAIIVSGVNVPQYNGTWQVTGGSGNTVTFSLPLGSNPGTGSGGTATDENILAFDASNSYPLAYPSSASITTGAAVVTGRVVN
ncbi:MAG TPA: hypothetical protein VGZ29_06270 [Terriglobia bacterium]|nr:hypothetical protein [Terriglobia bacterium]